MIKIIVHSIIMIYVIFTIFFIILWYIILVLVSIDSKIKYYILDY